MFLKNNNMDIQCLDCGLAERMKQVSALKTQKKYLFISPNKHFAPT